MICSTGQPTLSAILHDSACIHPNKLRFKIKDKPFVSKSSDQAAVPERRSEFKDTHSSVFKAEVVVG